MTAILAATAFVAGRFVRSPWQDAVANSSARPSTTAVLVMRQFSDSAAPIEGTVSLGGEIEVPAPDRAGVRPVVTSVETGKGESVVNGEPLASVSGRPLIALALEIPLYRDLGPGMTGPDIASLQHALGALGLYTGVPDGEYGEGTERAVEALYENSGYALPAPVPVVDEFGNPVQSSPANDVPNGSPRSEPSSSVDASEHTGEESVKIDEPEGPTGTPLPMSEVVDVPARKATVASVASRGAVLSSEKPLAVLRTGTPYIVARVDVVDQEAYQQGARVTVRIPGAETTSSVIESVSDFRPANDTGVAGYDIRVDLARSSLALLDSGAVASLTPESADQPTTSLAVPLTALREDAEGTFVLVDGAEPTRVPLTVGAQDDGYAQILEAEQLSEGVKVLIGGDHA